MIIRTTKQLGDTIRAQRHAADMTQEALAAKANVTRYWLSNLEAGKTTAQVGKVLAVLAALDLELTALKRDSAPLDRLDQILGDDG